MGGLVPGAPTDPVERTISLPATAAAPQSARRHVAGMPGMGGRLGYEALLLTSELVTFFLEGAEPDPAASLRLTVRCGRGGARVTLAGPATEDSVASALRSRDTPSSGGFGLRIVDRTADRWGAERGDGLALWFELSS